MEERPVDREWRRIGYLLSALVVWVMVLGTGAVAWRIWHSGVCQP